MKVPSWYKWVILCMMCITTFFSYGYITSTISIGTVYYIQRYDERLVSGLIGPFQTGFMQASALPSLFLCQKVGNRFGQIIGTALLVGGVAVTSLTTQSWQGLLLTGICAGSGGGLMHIATTNIMKKYFPGRQIAPFGAMALTINSAAMTFPLVWKELMTTAGWLHSLLILGAMLCVSFLCGLAYIEPAEDAIKAELAAQRKPKISLIPRRKSSALFLVSEEVQNENDCNNNDVESAIDEPTKDVQFDIILSNDIQADVKPTNDIQADVKPTNDTQANVRRTNYIRDDAERTSDTQADCPKASGVKSVEEKFAGVESIEGAAEDAISKADIVEGTAKDRITEEESIKETTDENSMWKTVTQPEVGRIFGISTSPLTMLQALHLPTDYRYEL